MKNLIYCLVVILLFSSCNQAAKPLTTESESVILRDGFYEVIKADTSSLHLMDSIGQGQVIVSLDTLFNPGDYTKVIIDTMDFVALELETAPTAEQQTENKKLLSISLTPDMAEKIKSFTAKRVMKHMAILLDGKAITMHKIREAITGDKMQITRCSDNACEYLFTKMKDRIKR